MLDNVGGSNSEMSAVSLYFYNHLTTVSCPDLAQAFQQISLVEMHHLDIFGALAMQLGEDPRLWTQCGSRKKYWSPAYNQYPIFIPKLLQNAIRGEKAAIQKYESQACRIKDPNIVEILQRIILDERRHIEILTQLYEPYCK